MYFMTSSAAETGVATGVGTGLVVGTKSESMEMSGSILSFMKTRPFTFCATARFPESFSTIVSGVTTPFNANYFNSALENGYCFSLVVV